MQPLLLIAALLLRAGGADMVTIAASTNNTGRVVTWPADADDQTRQQYVAALSCPKDQLLVQTNGARCCSKCPPGKIITSYCHLNGDTQCVSCVPNATFATGASCEICRVCELNDPNSRTETPCTVLEDTRCSCKPGFYLDRNTSLCTPCTRCSPGSGAATPCLSTSDTVCEACNQGTFSDQGGNYNQPCKRCTYCAFSGTSCTPVSDSNCTRLVFDSDDWIVAAVDTPSTTQNSSKTTSEEEWSSRGNDLIPLYCGFMGVIIVASIIYAIIKQRKLHARKRISKGTNETSSYKADAVVVVNSPSGLLTPTKHHISISPTASDATHTASPLLAPARPMDSYLLGEHRTDHLAVQLEDS